MQIRLAQPSDVAGIARVHVDSWRTTYHGLIPDDFLDMLSYENRERYWRSALDHPAETLQWLYVAANEDNQVVGFACGGSERERDPDYQGELYAIYLLVDYQKQGIGRELTCAIARSMSDEGITSMLVWVLAENPARAFYEALGGQYLREKPITIGSVELIEIAYGWRDIRALLT